MNQWKMLLNFILNWISFALIFSMTLKIAGFRLSNRTTVDNTHMREKRNVICYFGWTDLVKETLYSSLEDVRLQDPLYLGDAWDGKLHNGVLRGLSTLTNTSDMKVFCNEDNLIVFTTTLAMRDAEVLYKWSRRVLFKFRGSVWMKAKEVDFELEVRLNATNGLAFEVTNSLVTKVNDFEFGFKGLGVLNPLVRQVLKVMYVIWKEKAAGKIGSLLKKALEGKLGRVARSLDWIGPFL